MNPFAKEHWPIPVEGLIVQTHYEKGWRGSITLTPYDVFERITQDDNTLTGVVHGNYLRLAHQPITEETFTVYSEAHYQIHHNVPQEPCVLMIPSIVSSEDQSFVTIELQEKEVNGEQTYHNNNKARFRVFGTNEYYDLAQELYTAFQLSGLQINHIPTTLTKIYDIYRWPEKSIPTRFEDVNLPELFKARMEHEQEEAISKGRFLELINW